VEIIGGKQMGKYPCFVEGKFLRTGAKSGRQNKEINIWNKIGSKLCTLKIYFVVNFI